MCFGYSFLKAISGSTFVARRAGSQQATSATPLSNSATPTNVSGSVGATPYNKPCSQRVAATAACKAAVKKGTRLAPEEIGQLLSDLAMVEQGHTCPHGCPIAVELGHQELLKRFKRT